MFTRQQLDKLQLPLGQKQLLLELPSTSKPSKDISARALGAGGVMAVALLLRAGINPIDIRLQGCRKSWAMMEYLHKDAVDTTQFATTQFATAMLANGSYTILQLMLPYLRTLWTGCQLHLIHSIHSNPSLPSLFP